MDDDRNCDIHRDKISDLGLEYQSFSPDDMHVSHFAPVPALAAFVTQIYYFRCDQRRIRDRQPAALGHLMFFLRGSGSVRFQDGSTQTVEGAMQYGPGLASTEFELDGPVHILGFALSPLGFVALSGKPANMFADHTVPAAQLYGPPIEDLASEFSAGHADGSLSIADLIDKATAFLLSQVRPIPAAHVMLVQNVIDWLSSDPGPDVDALYAQLDMSRSTAARLISRYFGCAPKPLMRKYRALRAASVLIDPACTPALRTQIESLFYDQPHMIREIRQFAGRTPGALDGDDSRILRMWLSKDNYRDIKTFPG